MTERTDRDLVILSRQGDKEALGCPIERYQTLARRITPCSKPFARKAARMEGEQHANGRAEKNQEIP